MSLQCSLTDPFHCFCVILMKSAAVQQLAKRSHIPKGIVHM